MLLFVSLHSGLWSILFSGHSIVPACYDMTTHWRIHATSGLDLMDNIT